MRSELLLLAKRGEPFAFAIVVRRERPHSAQPGDMALITERGSFRGWLGGSCTQAALAQWGLQQAALIGPGMAIITAFLLLEKLAPESIRIGRLAGALLIGWGGWMLLGALG
jgi:xanthine/CO dehydrogenase XdhC/CoxF family maturation factor